MIQNHGQIDCILFLPPQNVSGYIYLSALLVGFWCFYELKCNWLHFEGVLLWFWIVNDR